MSRNNRFEHGTSKTFPSSPTAPRPPRRILASAGKRLSTIMENSNPTTQAPSNGSFAKKFLMTENPLRKNHNKEPAIYEMSPASEANSSSIDSERHRILAENRHIARRGGWKRLALILLLLLLTLIALGLGLGLGLSRKLHPSDSTTPSSDFASGTNSSALPTATPGVPSSSPQFPLGTYSLTTYLATVNTNCTSNSATWTCFPYTTYTSNPSTALTTFNWALSMNGTTDNAREISALQDPFALNFASEPLALLDANLPTERYTLNITLPKQVSPSTALAGANGEVSTCFYNSTTLQAELYMKMASSNNDSSSTGGGGNGGSGGEDSSGGGAGGASYPAWPFAVRVEQVATGGEGVPDCYEMENGVVGQRITTGLESEGPASECSCVYQNFDLGT
ncbi:MAG: hypothetical protein M1822_006354 [Bathelium mastoideum]|nr:MAG: hypothetical protein M1822_006354 [Bathelium mastoideum]